MPEGLDGRELGGELDGREDGSELGLVLGLLDGVAVGSAGAVGGATSMVLPSSFLLKAMNPAPIKATATTAAMTIMMILPGPFGCGA